MAVYWNNAGTAYNWTANPELDNMDAIAFLEGSNVELQDQKRKYDSATPEQRGTVYLI